jgi:hypothetical protein
MRKLLSFLVAPLLSATAHSAVLYQYEGTAHTCQVPYDFTPENCIGPTAISLWVRDDNTLDKVIFTWQGTGLFYPNPYGRTIDRNTIPEGYTLQTVDESGAVSLRIWYHDFAPFDGLGWWFASPDNWLASFGSLSHYVRVKNGVAVMGQDGNWEATSTVQRVAAGQVPEPNVLWLLAVGAVAGLALRRRQLIK